MSFKQISPKPVIEGGTGAQTFTNHGLLVGSGTSAIAALAVGTNPSVLVGNTGSNPSFSATPAVTSITITDLPVNATDGVNKMYADLIAAGFTVLTGCFATTTANLNATYSNGAAGVGATLTNAGTNAAFSTDGTSPAVNARILVRNQTSTFENGIYALTTVGDVSTPWVLTRTTDYDTTVEITAGDIVPVSDGILYSTSLWLQTQTVAAIGTDPILFNQFFGSGITTVLGDSGTTFGPLLSIVGGDNILTAATTGPSALTINVRGTTNHALQMGNASGSLTSLGVATNGQIPIGSTGANPVLATLSAGTGITITNGAGSILIDSTEGTVTSVSAGNSISITGTATDPVVNVSGTVFHALQVGSASGALSSLGAAVNGQIPIGSTGNNPSIANITAGSGISVVNGAGSITISTTNSPLTITVTTIDITDSPYTVTGTDYYISTISSGGSVTVLLPNAPALGRTFIIKDSTGNAGTNNIGVRSVSGTVNIDGSNLFVMNTAYEAASFVFNAASAYEVY